MTKERVLTVRKLNRATLDRQMLLKRENVDVVEAIERLAALQAQWSPSPYVALWSRIARFRREVLWSAIEKEHTVVRARLMRGTLHLVSARDFYAYSVATQDLQRGAWNRLQIARGVDPRAVARAASAYAKTPRSKEEVLAHLAERVAKIEGEWKWLIWRFVSAHADLVAAPPSGHWEYGGTDHPYVAARHWIRGGTRPSEREALRLLVTRYLRAFGPATLADIARFGGQAPPRLRPAVEEMPLVRYRDESGRILFDLPGMRLPRLDVRTPVRLLPRWDELLIAYQYRDRIAPKRYLSGLYRKNGIIEASFLVDGFVAGTWTLVRTKTDGVVRIRPFAKLPTSAQHIALAEGDALSYFLAPEAKVHGAGIDPAGLT
jgi:hypothetical protein